MARAFYHGHDSCMAAFDNMRPKGNPYFSVWVGVNIIYQYNGDDDDEGREKLSEMLAAAQQLKNREVFIIKFHPGLDGGYINNKTKTIGQLPVCAYDPKEDVDYDSDVSVAGARPGNVSSAVWGKLNKIEEMMNGQLEARFKALEDAKAEPVQVSGFDWGQQITGLLQQPGAIETIGALLQPIVGSIVGILGKVAPPVAPVQNLAISGADPKKNPASTVQTDPVSQENSVVAEPREYTDAENDIMDEAISQLSDYCDPVICLPALVKYAADPANKAMFGFLINQLQENYAK